MNAKIVILLGLAALVAADSREFYGSNSDSGSFESGEYNFNWAVDDDSSENHYGHQETRDGDQTQGSYYVQLPDGRLQKVAYYVDGDSGYVADVTYSGEARFDSGSYESRSFESRSFEYGSNESK